MTPFPTNPDKSIAHLAAAEDLLKQQTLNRWMAIGHIAEAECCSAGLPHSVMARIRHARHQIEKENTVPNLNGIMQLLKQT